MTLVEWTRLEGGQVEAVVGMLVNREHPRSIRITPSKGDGGVDILDRRAGLLGTDHVYQVKRYTEPLTSKQKTEVANSLKALATDPRWSDLNVTEWFLVTPWNPTPEAEHWLQELATVHGLTPTWHGLDYVEQLAAKYDDVVDYYLRGGRARVEEAYAQVTALVGAASLPEDLSARDVGRRLEVALRALDHDPHYRYEHRIGGGIPPPAPTAAERPGLVMHFRSTPPNAGRWHSVDVIARCEAAVDGRPITIAGVFKATPGSDFARQLDEFRIYGTPFTSPPGAFDGQIDAPGGLGGHLTGAILRIGPTDDADLGLDPQQHLEVLDTSGDVLAAVDVDRVERTAGVGGGLRAVVQETNEVFTLETKIEPHADRGTRTIHVGDVKGLPVAAARQALHFLSQLREPHRLRTSVRGTPGGLGVVDPHVGFEWPEETLDSLERFINTLQVLEKLQAHSPDRILVPDADLIDDEQARDWAVMEAVLDGHKLVATYADEDCLALELSPEVSIPSSGTFTVIVPLQTLVGDQIVRLGTYHFTVPEPTHLDSTPHDDVVVHRFTTPDRKVYFQLDGPVEPEPDEPTNLGEGAV